MSRSRASVDVVQSAADSYRPPSSSSTRDAVAGPSSRPTPSSLPAAAKVHQSPTAPSNMTGTVNGGGTNVPAASSKGKQVEDGVSRSVGVTSRTAPQGTCQRCGEPMQGQFVRALGMVFHLDCFCCEDCSNVVHAKFFPLVGADGQQRVLCERDYFRRLGLLCGACGTALRGSYITALDRKYHVACFSCSVCTTVFGPQDSYYEHHGNVYCHFHYSCRFAVKCTGCRVAILKQFVEINRNNTDEHWHPECYMIHKFWNTKLASTPRKRSPSPPTTLANGETAPVADSQPPSNEVSAEVAELERTQTPESLRIRQRQVEEQVYRIWTVLSTFEESSAACISEMLRQVSGGHYLDGVNMAEKFILHVESLFAAIDDLAGHFRAARTKEFSHVRESRMLCKKIVSFFSLLSQSQESGARKLGITQELLSLVTGLAHYLKILIRIALTAALKLERDYDNTAALAQFLGRLDRLARDPDIVRTARSGGATPVPTSASPRDSEGRAAKPIGYRSLDRAIVPTIGDRAAATDLCEGCRATIEDECARLGPHRRWHLACLRCRVCQRTAAARADTMSATSAALQDFRSESEAGRDANARSRLDQTVCTACVPSATSLIGFEAVTRLEQYAFLLCVALNKLYDLLKSRGVAPVSPPGEVSDAPRDDDRSLYDAYRDSADVKRMKSVNLDRKLSTTARTPKRSTVIESPAGRAAQMSEAVGTVSAAAATSVTAAASAAAVLPPIDTVLPASKDRSSASRTPRESPRDGSGILSTSTDRPGMTRSLTAVRVVDDQWSEAGSPRDDATHPLGDVRTQDENGITLADLPVVMEAEQAREQQRPVMRQTQVTLLSELSALEYIIVKHVAAMTLAGDSSPVRDLLQTDDLLELLDARKNNNFWGKIFKGGTEKKGAKKRGVFGIPLEALVERSGADSMLGAGAAPVRVPSFIDDVLSAMRQMDMSVEGVFRKNGNIRRLKDLCDALDRDVPGINLVDDNPVQLAALLKKFLRELPDPLLTHKLHHLFVATQRIESTPLRLRVLHLVSCLLPKAHRDTMEVIFVFLKWVASFSHVDEETGSKMDLHNLATVVTPNVLFAKTADASVQANDSFLGIRAVLELLENQDIFWQVPDELAGVLQDELLFSSPEALSSKEILRRCGEYAARIQRPGSQQRSPRAARGAAQVPQHPLITASSQAGGWTSPAQHWPAERPSATPPPRLSRADDGAVSAIRSSDNGRHPISA